MTSRNHEQRTVRLVSANVGQPKVVATPRIVDASQEDLEPGESHRSEVTSIGRSFLIVPWRHMVTRTVGHDALTI
jgi:hypothetical protein